MPPLFILTVFFFICFFSVTIFWISVIWSLSYIEEKLLCIWLVYLSLTNWFCLTVKSPFNYVLILVTSATLSPLLFYPRRLEFLAPFYTMWPRIDDKIIMKPGCLLDWLSIDMIALQVIHTIWSYSSWILQPKLENLKKITGSAQMRFCDVPS